MRPAASVTRVSNPAARLAWLAPVLAVAFVVGSLHAAVAPPGTGWTTFGGGVTRPGSTAATVTSTRSAWFTPLPGMVTTQPLVAANVPVRGDSTVYLGTAAGFVYALAPNGYVRWRVDLGRQLNSCPQIPDGWGVTGTPVIDAAGRTLYAVDAFGRLHALDLATGRERAGWPIVLYDDPGQELDWAALTLVAGSVYVPTGSFCDQPPMQGKLIRVDLATRQVTSWSAVPLSAGGGGSIWGWGGAVFSPTTDSFYVVTGNALASGGNTGAAFDEQAGYGEQLVQLSPDLVVRAASKPPLPAFPDDDFVGSPVVADPPGCGELVAAQSKSGVLLGWRANAVAAGPAWRLSVQKPNPDAPLLTQPAYSPALRSFYVVTWTSLLRIQLDASCKPHVAWSLPLGQATLEGSPTVAGDRVWFALSGPHSALVEVDAGTGRRIETVPVGGISFTPPTVVDGTVYMGAAHGFAARPFAAAAGRPASAVPGHTSSSDARHTWQSREDGVYATDDGGRTWRRIYAGPAVAVVRTSTEDGVIAVGSPASACNCSTTQLWTADGGRTWHALPEVGGDFQGRGSRLYWWTAAALYELAWPPKPHPASRRIATTDGQIVSAVDVPGGIAALVDRREQPPQVIVSRGGAASTVTLPDAGDTVVPRTLTAAWPDLTVTGTDYTHPSAAPDPTVTWQSRDGGVTWTVGR